MTLPITTISMRSMAPRGLQGFRNRGASPRSARHHELVINHTSDAIWFQIARRAPPGSAKRDYYV